MAKILLLCLFGLSSLKTGSGHGTLMIWINNLESTRGSIRLAVYDQAHFLVEDKEVLRKLVRLRGAGEKLRVELPGLSFGHYALAIYHDLNDNGKLDTNLLGIPTEPYAFSNNPGVKWRSPHYEEARFEFSRDRQVVEVIMQRWRSR